MLRIAINGFGRIGRNFLRTILLDPQAKKTLSVVAINIGPSNPEMAAHMFLYDSLMGKYPGSVRMKGNELLIDDVVIPVVSYADPAQADWAQFAIDWVVEASGKFTDRTGAQKHIAAGAKKVLITAPASDEDATIIPGVNSGAYDAKKDTIVSLGSCTTNALLPMLKVLNDTFIITQGFMTTVHAYTNDQRLLDVEHADPRRARAAAINIIPTTTGVAKLVGKIIPSLNGLLGASSLRVPVAKVSLIDLSVLVQKPVSIATVNQAFFQAAQGYLKDILSVSQEPLVSSDYSGDAHSVIIDSLMTDVRGNSVKIFGWYDNEWGYSERLKDFLVSVANT